MFFTIFIVIICLIGLLILHELGHFILAKKFGVGVEEFGIGIPPRIFGKKFGETIYSINLLPLGAFVKLVGEDGGDGGDGGDGKGGGDERGGGDGDGEGSGDGEKSEKKIVNPRSFSQKPIWQRSLIIFGGVASFWLVAFLIFTLVAGIWGLSQEVSDDFSGTAHIRIIELAKNSPAEISGIKAGDEILGFKTRDESNVSASAGAGVGADNDNTKLMSFIKINKIREVQEFTQGHLGEKITLTLKRGQEILDIDLTPRLESIKGEGAMGVALTRISRVKVAWYQAPIKGALMTIENTIKISMVLIELLKKSLRGEKIEGVELRGPIGMVDILGQSLNSGADKFLFFLAMLSIWLALFNLLPIPALDGGKLLFLAIEAIKRKPISQKIEQGITAFFFVLLFGLMLFVTAKDIMRYFHF